MTLRLPVPQPFGTALLRRSAWMWLLLRALVMSGAAGLGALFQALPGDPVSRFSLEPVAAAALVALVAALTVVDARRRNETIFLANLGVPGWGLIGWAAIVPAACEIVIGMAL